MPKADLRSWSTTAVSNSDVEGINLAEDWASANMNNSIRAIMAELKVWFNYGVTRYQTKAVNFTIDATDNDTAETSDIHSVFVCTAALTATLPAAATATADFSVFIINRSTGLVTIDGNAAETINGRTTITLGIGDSCLLVCDGTSWYALGLSDWTMLGKATASASASIVFTNASVFAAEFDVLMIELVEILPATDNVSFRVRVSEDGGATYKAGVSDYKEHRAETTSAATTYAASAGANSLIGLGSSLGNAATEGYSGILYLFKPSGTTQHKKFRLHANYIDNAATPNTVNVDGAASYVLSAAAINALEFAMGSGNIASGVVRVWGHRLDT